MVIRNNIDLPKIWLCYLLLCFATSVHCVGQLIYAVNCGGDAHTDAYGIRYERDPLHGRIGIASDYGKRLLIGRVPPNDYILYQTERYHTSTFGYDIPVIADGDYVLVLKFCEVYFNAPDQKVFDVVLNGEHTIIADLDIYEKVGRGVAHDEYIPFKITKGKCTKLIIFLLLIIHLRKNLDMYIYLLYHYLELLIGVIIIHVTIMYIAWKYTEFS